MDSSQEHASTCGCACTKLESQTQEAACHGSESFREFWRQSCCQQQSGWISIYLRYSASLGSLLMSALTRMSKTLRDCTIFYTWIWFRLLSKKICKPWGIWFNLCYFGRPTAPLPLSCSGGLSSSRFARKDRQWLTTVNPDPGDASLKRRLIRFGFPSVCGWLCDLHILRHEKKDIGFWSSFLQNKPLQMRMS